VNRTTGAEESIAVATGTTPTSTDKIRVEKTGGTYEDIPYSALQTEMALSAGGATTITPYESTIADNDPVGLVYDGLFECTTEVKSSANITVSSITKILGQAAIDATRTLFVYAVGLTVFARVASRSTTDVITYGTEVTVGTGSTGTMSGGCCLVDTDKCAVIYVDGSGTPTYTNRILTFSGTTITQGATATQTFNIVGGTPTLIYSVVKVRTTAYAWV
jgi:hypothetical protein